ncbi:MAG TPA: hypothetical protein VIS94_16560 [Desulfomonilia bacterium]
MRRYSGLPLLIVLVSLIFTGCPKLNYVPCSIQVISPVRGSVLPADSGPVTITGRVIKGDSDPWTLKVNGKKVVFDQATGNFTCTFQPKASSIFNTVVFSIMDKKLVTNTERVSFPVGQSMRVGEVGAVNDALRIHMDQDLLDLVMAQVSDVLNSVTRPLIYGPTEDNELLSMLGITDPLLASPIDVSLNPFGRLVIDKDEPNPRWNGQINIGQISIIPDIVAGNKIMGSVIISPTEGVDPDRTAALYIQGYHWNVVQTNHFALSIKQLKVEGAEISLYMNGDGTIGAKMDLTKGNIVVGLITTDYGYLTMPNYLLTALLNVVIKQYLMESLSISFDLMNVSDLSLNLLDIDIAMWPMNSSILTTSDDDLNLDLGISAAYTGPTPAVPGLDTFLATPGDIMPSLDKVADENIMIAVSDDMMNQTMVALIQTGLLSNLNLDDLLSSLTSEPAQLSVSLLTPPVMDLSGKKTLVLNSKVTSMGCVLVRDLLVEVRLKAAGMPLVLRLNVDADAYLMLKIKDTGNIGVTIDPLWTNFNIKILYLNGLNTSLVPGFGRLIFNAILPTLLDSILDIAPPAIDLMGKNISIQVVGTEAKDNFLIGRAKIVVN